MHRDSYDDIIHLPHPVSRDHPPMPRSDRAAQFSPFAALTGYGDVIEESGRLTDGRVELDASRIEELDRQLQHILSVIQQRPRILITYFVQDPRKAGGAYLTLEDEVRKIDLLGGILFLSQGGKIPIDHIVDLVIL